MSGLFTWIRISILSCLLVVMVVGFWTYNRSVPQATPAETASAVPTPVPTTQPGRDIEHVVLHTETLGDIGMTLNLPNPQPAGKMPILMLIGGPTLASQDIANIQGAGNNVIVGYDWPLPRDLPPPGDFIHATPALYNQTMHLPAQLGAAMNWLASQPWADESRLSLMGFELGSSLVPASEESLQRLGHIVRWTVIVHGGAPISALISSNQALKPDIWRMTLAALGHIVLHPLDPDLHLPNCTGHFLLMESGPNGPIPIEAVERLRNATPEPRTSIAFDAETNGKPLDHEAFFLKSLEAARAWLINQGALNPT